jgi:hypothetical protein
MHGHAMVRKLIGMIRELRKERESCTCGGDNGIVSRNTEQISEQVRLTT